MNGITTITTKGQVTIPEVVRTQLQIKTGDRVLFAKVNPKENEALIRIIPSNVVKKLGGSLATKVRITNYKKARKEAGKLLLKKYHIRP